MSWLDPLLALKTQQAGTTAGTRQTINFASGATVVDDPANDRVNVTITDTGITQLTGDVTAGPGSGSIAATVAKVNGVSVSGTPSSGQVIRATSGTASAWANVARGDVTNTSGAVGDLITGDATTLGRLAIGSTGQVLTVSGGAPVWSNPGWFTAYEIDFTAQTPATYTANGTYTIGGQSWVLSGYNTGVTADLSVANGLRIQNAASTALRNVAWTSPSFATLGVGGSRYQLWAYYGPSLASAGTGSAESSVHNIITNSRAPDTHVLHTIHNWYAAACCGAPIGNSFATFIVGGPSFPTYYPPTPTERSSNTTNGITSTGPNVIVMEFSGGDRVDVWTGSWSSGWPTWQSLTYRGYVAMNLANNPTSSSSTISLMGPGEPAYRFQVTSATTSTATTGNLRNMRIMTR